MSEKISLLDKAICGIAPEMGMRRLAAKRVLKEYRYDGAASTTKRSSAPHNMSPNSFDVQRDRLQLMREAEDMERNFAPALMLNRKVSMYCSPTSYHAITGDEGLSKEVEEYLNEVAFKQCDITRRYDFFKMLEFGMMGMNRSGDYGWAFMREGFEEGMIEDDLVKLPLKIQAVEADRIGGVYQNVVSDDYVSGCVIGEHGEITDFRVFQRSMATNQYTNPTDIPASDFVHLTDTMRIDQYRGVSKLATAIQNLRDLYEMIDFVKGKAKLASALTVFTNSNGVTSGSGAMDAYSTNLYEGNASGLQQDIQFGQINHLQSGADIKFPSSNSPSSEEQALMTTLLKFVAMSYNLPFSFALDAAALGGVSSRLESEMAKAEFNRLKAVISPHADRMKNMFLADAVAKGYFKIKDLQRMTKGRWGYRAHPQPDIGREATAAISLYETGLLDPMEHWVDNSQDPETVASNMMRWHQIKSKAVEGTKFNVEEVFGNGPAKPVTTSESMTESVTVDETDSDFNKEFSTLHHFKESDASIDKRIEKETENVEFGKDWISDMKETIGKLKDGSDPEGLQKARSELDKANAYLKDHEAKLAKLEGRKARREREGKKNPQDKPEVSRKAKQKAANDRRALLKALESQGYKTSEAYAIAYDIIDKGKFDKSKLPSDIRNAYYSSKRKINSFKEMPEFDESKHPRGKDGKFGTKGSASTGRSKKAKVGEMAKAVRKDGKIMIGGKEAPSFIKSSMIPPAYSHNIKIAKNKDSDVWATMEDSKGNSKRVYNPDFIKKNEMIKWARTNEGVANVESIRSEIKKDLESGRDKENAAATWLMSIQATRPGSESDTKGNKELWDKKISSNDFQIEENSKGVKKVSLNLDGKKIPIRDKGAIEEISKRIENGEPMGDAGYWIKSYGATTLEGRHIIENSDGSVNLQFMGKEGVWHDHKVGDKNLAKMLLERKKESGDEGKIFNTNYSKVSKYVKGLAGGGYTPKDMRTIKANEEALKLLGGDKIKVKTLKDKKELVKNIAEKVSSLLGNRPQQALQSYINPMIFNVIKVESEK